MPTIRTFFKKTTKQYVLHSFYKSVEKGFGEHFNPHRVAQFCTNLRICTVVEQIRKTYNRMIEMMKEETNPDAVLILAVLEKAVLNTFRIISSKQKSRAVISTRNNFLPEKHWVGFENLLLVSNAWKQFEDSVVGKWMKLQYISETITTKNSEKDMQIVPSSYEIRNSGPYLRTLAIFRWKTFVDWFWYLLFLLLCFKNSPFLLSENNSVFWFLAEKDIMLKVCLIYCDTSLRPPVVRLRTLTSLAVLFNPTNTVSWESGSTIRLWAV